MAVNTINQLLVTTVRAQGSYNATRGLLVAGFSTDIAKTCVSGFSAPTDPAGAGKLFLSIDYYEPFTSALTEDLATWQANHCGHASRQQRADLEIIERPGSDCSNTSANRGIGLAVAHHHSIACQGYGGSPPQHDSHAVRS